MLQFFISNKIQKYAKMPFDKLGFLILNWGPVRCDFWQTALWVYRLLRELVLSKCHLYSFQFCLGNNGEPAPWV